MQLLLPELLLAPLLVLHLMEWCSISTSVEIAKLRLIDRKQDCIAHKGALR